MVEKQSGKKVKTYIYTDELHDEFSGVTRNTIQVDESFPFIHRNPIWRAASFFVYRVIMTPFAFLYMKIRFHTRIVGREKFRVVENGCFLFANHTMMAGDAFLPSIAAFPKRTHVIVNADNLSVRGLKNYIQMCGAIPIPHNLRGLQVFTRAVGERIAGKCCIAVYPEAHIWPYYTGIRPFPSDSFSFPVKTGAPVFTAVTTYAKRRRGNAAKITVYIDGPFYPDASVSGRQAREKLRDEVYEAMCGRAKLNSYEKIRYVKGVKSER